MGASSGIEPVNSSAQNSKTCGEVISSNCVKWAGGGKVGNLTICEGASMTDVITAMGDGCCGGGGGGFTPVSCAAAGWVNTGTPAMSPVDFNGASATFLGTYDFYGNPAFASIPMDQPSYKYSADGNLMLRGGFDIEYNASANIGYVFMDLGVVDTTCFPSTFTKAQVVLTEVEVRDVQKLTQFMKAYAILYPNGGLRVLLQHNFGQAPWAYRWAISLGGVQFNLT